MAERNKQRKHLFLFSGGPEHLARTPSACPRQNSRSVGDVQIDVARYAAHAWGMSGKHRIEHSPAIADPWSALWGPAGRFSRWTRLSCPAVFWGALRWRKSDAER